jgi:hypothetical protein
MNQPVTVPIKSAQVFGGSPIEVGLLIKWGITPGQYQVSSYNNTTRLWEVEGAPFNKTYTGEMYYVPNNNFSIRLQRLGNIVP